MMPKLPSPSQDADIHPGDFVVLADGDPYYVGDHPAIADAFRLGTKGRVTQRIWKALTEKEASALGKPAEFEVAVKFPGVNQLFFFWQMFLKKIHPENKAKEIV